MILHGEDVDILDQSRIMIFKRLGIYVVELHNIQVEKMLYSGM